MGMLKERVQDVLSLLREQNGRRKKVLDDGKMDAHSFLRSDPIDVEGIEGRIDFPDKSQILEEVESTTMRETKTLKLNSMRETMKANNIEQFEKEIGTDMAGF